MAELSDDRKKALNVAMKQIERQHGKGAIMRLGNEGARVKAEAIPTGAINLDQATGIGGVPRGRITEIYGPEASGKTTLTLHVIANAQKQGGVAAFIDAEHALDVQYAEKLGVDTENLLVSQPDTGEQALEIAEVLVRSGALDVVVVDSVAALVPRAEIEGEMGDSHVGLQARLMSQAMRKLTGAIGRSDTALVFTNQIREKIGVMFGCFQYNTRVTLADGSSEKIGKIVNQEMDVEVLSYDPESGKIEPRKVVNWYDNGTAERFLQFEVEGGPSGRRKFAATPNHTVFTPDGPRPAGELGEGDRVLTMVEDYALTADQEQVILGGALGDGSLRKAGTHTAHMRVGHGAQQSEYVDWKRWMLEPFSSSLRSMGNGEGFRTKSMPVLEELRGELYKEKGQRTVSSSVLEQIDARGLAVWYADDGSFAGSYDRWGKGKAVIYNSSLDEESRERVGAYFERIGVGRPRDDGRGFWFNSEQTERFHAMIAQYLHPSMVHKLHPEQRDQFNWEPDLSDAHLNGDRLDHRRHLRAVPATIVRCYEKPKTRSMRRFDLEVEGNHTYMVDGVVVHNSPETTSGGRALKFYASLRLDIRRVASIKEGNEQVGNRTRVKVVKNKCLAAGTRVFDPSTGETHTIEEMVEEGKGVTVVAAGDDGRLERRHVLQRFDQGEAEVIGLRLQDGTELRVTPDHEVLTDDGWREAGELSEGDRLARPRRAGSFGDEEPFSADEGRLLGYLVGDGYVGGKTPVTFVNADEELRDDVTEIVAGMGCDTDLRGHGYDLAISHRPGEKNEVLELCRRTGIYGCLAWEKKLPAELFSPRISEEVLGNVLMGLWESDGYVSREQTGGLRLGFTTTSEQLAHQLHWLLLRWGIGSSVRAYDPTQQRPSLIDGRRIEARRPCYDVRISGIENVQAFAESVPTWGPKGRVLEEHLDDPELAKHRGSQRVYLRADQGEPIVEWLRDHDVSPTMASSLSGWDGNPSGGLRQVIGPSRPRRDRVEALATSLDSEFLTEQTAEDLWYDRIVEVLPARTERVYDIHVAADHTLVADDVVVSNCASPFKQAEFDIMYDEGISREGLLIDLGEEHEVIARAGAWYSYGEDDDVKLGQGKENARQFLKENPDLRDEIEEKVKREMGLLDDGDEPGAEAAGEEADGESADGEE